MIHVATYIEVQQSSISDAVILIRQYRDASRSESGNKSVDALQETVRQNRFVVVETWKEESALQTHETVGSTTDFRSKLGAIHISPYDRRLHQSFAVGPESRVIWVGTLAVVTHVDVPPPRKDETEILLRNLAEQSRGDEGNVRFDVYQQNAPRTNHFTVYAVWKDESAFVSHETKPHSRQFRDALGPMLGAPYDDRIYKYLS
jgi:quinol monooxygenase YgiN